MTPLEFDYIKRAIKELEEPLSLATRIKITKTMSQILARDAANLEKVLVDKVEDRLYNTNTEKEGA